VANHVREQIVTAVVSAVTGLGTTGANVFRDRDTDENPLHAAELPGLVVEDDGEPAEIASMGVSRLLSRTMRIRFVAHVKAASGYSAQLNQILKEIEVGIAASGLGGAKHASFVEAAAREQAEGGDKPAVRQAFSFEFFYITAHNAPDVAL
jgi:hypothetical protein